MSAKNSRYLQPLEVENGVAPTPLLPLVDILFSAVGIFLIFISLNAVLRTRTNMPPAQADAVIVCASGNRYTLYTHDKPLGLEIRSDNLRFSMEKLLEGRERPVTLMAAFSSASFDEVDRVEKIAGELSWAGGDTGGPAVGFETMFWPLPGPESREETTFQELVKHMTRELEHQAGEQEPRHRH